MKKINLFLLTLLIGIRIIAQSSPSDFLNDKCYYQTDGTGKAVGLKIKLTFPCSWTQANGDRPHVVQKFTYSFVDGSQLIQSLTISQMAATFSKKEVDLLLTQQGLKELTKEFGTFISGRKVKIDGEDCGEVVVKMKREMPSATVNIYFIHYYFFFKGKMINLSFASGGASESNAKALFAKYKLLFQTLATNTVLLSKWE